MSGTTSIPRRRDGDSERVHKPEDPPEKAAHRRQSERATWWGVVLPPSLLLLQISVNYAVVPWACRTGHVWALHLVSLGCLAGALAGVWICWRAWTALGRAGPDSHEGTLSPARSVALGGVAFSAAMALAILAVELPTFVLGPCD